jgi:hypothetical protein
MSHRFDYERQNLVPSLSELSSQTQREYDQENLYATKAQAFYDQNLVDFVSDEVHGMMQILFCQSRWCTHFYNPLYLILFAILFVFTFPGALLHYWLLDCVPVRCTEYPEERELRSQGIYTAIGIALLSIPVGIYAIVAETSNQDRMFSAMSLAVSVCIIGLNFVALKAVADSLVRTMRVFIVSVWIIVAILVGITLFDIATDYGYISVSDGLIFSLRLLEIFVFTVIGAQCAQFWNMYSETYQVTGKKGILRDSCLAAIEGIIAVLILTNFVYVITVTEQSAWRLFIW